MGLGIKFCLQNIANYGIYSAHKRYKFTLEGVPGMKKLSVVLVVVLSLCLVVSMAFAADMKKGTIKSVDAKAGSVVVTIDGKDHTFKADKAVDLGKVKVGEAVELSVEKDTVKSISAAAAAPAKKKAPVGC
jgi:hypothetical protein